MLWNRLTNQLQSAITWETEKEVEIYWKVQMKMAAEVSRRSEDERRRKLQLQEEADLAYAIALSKAEAASLKSQ